MMVNDHELPKKLDVGLLGELIDDFHAFCPLSVIIVYSHKMEFFAIGMEIKFPIPSTCHCISHVVLLGITDKTRVFYR